MKALCIANGGDGNYYEFKDSKIGSIVYDWQDLPVDEELFPVIVRQYIDDKDFFLRIAVTDKRLTTFH